MAVESLRIPGAPNHGPEDLALEVGRGPTEQHLELRLHDEDGLRARIVVEVQDVLLALRVLRAIPPGGLA